MMYTTIRDSFEGGQGDDVALETSAEGVKVLYGPKAINATINLDWDEARELAEAILIQGDNLFLGALEGKHVRRGAF